MQLCYLFQLIIINSFHGFTTKSRFTANLLDRILDMLRVIVTKFDNNDFMQCTHFIIHLTSYYSSEYLPENLAGMTFPGPCQLFKVSSSWLSLLK